jgi:hypothetical protein
MGTVAYMSPRDKVEGKLKGQKLKGQTEQLPEQIWNPDRADGMVIVPSLQCPSLQCLPALNRKLPTPHGSGTKELTGKKELNRRDDYSLRLWVIIPSRGFRAANKEFYVPGRGGTQAGVNPKLISRKSARKR